MIAVIWLVWVSRDLDDGKDSFLWKILMAFPAAPVAATREMPLRCLGSRRDKMLRVSSEECQVRSDDSTSRDLPLYRLPT